MKTAKEKAKELIDNFTLISTGGFDLAKESALICVDEILLLYKNNWNIENSYWQEVKSEIEKL